MRLPNSYGGVVKLGGKRRKPYAARLTVGWNENGKQIYKYIGYFENSTDALQALADYHKVPYDLSTVNITFNEVYKKWSAQRFPTLSKSSLNNYKGAYKHCKSLHKLPMKQIKAAQLQAVIDNSGLALETSKHIKGFMKKIFGYAIENDIIVKDYTEYVRLDKIAPSKPVRSVFTENEISCLWKNKNVVNADIALILIYTGLRIGELLDITADNVHIDERYMVGGKKTAAGLDRIIPINEKIVPLIKNRLRGGKYLITSVRGGKMQYTYFSSNYWADLMKTLKMSHTPHDARATFASLIDRTDANKTSIKRILGHASGTITEHYTHKDIADLLEAVNKI